MSDPTEALKEPEIRLNCVTSFLTGFTLGQQCRKLVVLSQVAKVAKAFSNAESKRRPETQLPQEVWDCENFLQESSFF